MAVTGLSDEFKATVDVLFSLYGRPDHAASYHGEGQRKDGWEMDHHKDWVELTHALMEKLRLDIPEIQFMLGRVSKLFRESTYTERQLLSLLDYDDTCFRAWVLREGEDETRRPSSSASPPSGPDSPPDLSAAPSPDHSEPDSEDLP